MKPDFPALNARLLTVLVILLLSCVITGIAAAADSSNDCSKADTFAVEGPSDWAKAGEPTRDGMTYTFVPPGETMENSRIAMAVRMPNLDANAGHPDLDRLLEKRLGMLAMLGDPISIRDVELKDAGYPTRAAALKLRTGTLHYAVVDAQSGHGHTFVASFAKQDGSVTAGELEQFSSMIASLNIDSASCAATSNEPTVSVFPASISAEPKETRVPASESTVAMRRAFMGCRWLDKMDIPVECKVKMAARRPALVAAFSPGRDSAAANLDRYHKRIAAPYCWGAQRHDLPRLVFQTTDGDGSEGRIREYSCSSAN